MATRRKPQPLPSRPLLEGQSPVRRSRVTNGAAVFIGGAAEGEWTRRFCDLIRLHASDLGGEDMLSEAQMSIIRRCATISVRLEAMEAKMSQGEDVSLDLYQRASNTLVRALKTIGLERVSREVNPHHGIAEYVAAKRRAEAIRG